MANVVGLTVWVKLKQPPPHDILYGVVQDLVPNSHLALRNVVIPGTSTRWEYWTVQATAIENLEVIDPSSVPQPLPQPPPPPPTLSHPQNYPTPPGPPPPPTFRPTSHPHQPSSSVPVELMANEHLPQQHVHPPAAPRSAVPYRELVDPAIVSYGTASPTPQKPTAKLPEFETPIKSMLAKAASNLPSPGSPFIAEVGKANVAQKLREAAQPPSNAHAPQQTRNPAPPVRQDEVSQEVNRQNGIPEQVTKKKVRRGQKKKQAANPIGIADPPPIMNVEVSRNGNDMNGGVKRGKGWRDTPLLQPSPQTVGPMEKANAKKNRRRQNEDDALGDTTDIADMGDFDFEGELKKFDKKQVFDEIRQGDTTADEDRLVSHNKARPGTYGGKNLHPTEPVLSPHIQSAHESNELDSASEADTELNLANGRSSSKHSISRSVNPKTKPSRQNSAHLVENKHHPLASLSSEMHRTRSATSLVSRAKATSLAASSPRPDRAVSPQSGGSAAPIRKRSPKPAAPHFAIKSNLAACPTLLPRALENLENATVASFGITHDAITESAGRCIAEAALQLSVTDSIRRPSRTNTLRNSITSSTVLNDVHEPPTVVVLAGNHLIGARALAAARHLLGRDVRIIVAEGLYETDETQHPQCKAQSTILRRMARGGASVKRGLWDKASSHIKNLSGPPTVIIDALLAGLTYDSLPLPAPVGADDDGAYIASYAQEQQQETREMIDWANRSRAPVLSVACPSGVSGLDGSATLLDGEPLAVRPDKVLALAAPMQGLLRAMQNGEKWDDIAVADIGLNIALKSDEAVAFAAGWAADLAYVDSSADVARHAAAATADTAAAGAGIVAAATTAAALS